MGRTLSKVLGTILLLGISHRDGSRNRDLEPALEALGYYRSEFITVLRAPSKCGLMSQWIQLKFL